MWYDAVEPTHLGDGRHPLPLDRETCAGQQLVLEVGDVVLASGEAADTVRQTRDKKYE